MFGKCDDWVLGSGLYKVIFMCIPWVERAGCRGERTGRASCCPGMRTIRCSAWSGPNARWVCKTYLVTLVNQTWRLRIFCWNYGLSIDNMSIIQVVIEFCTDKDFFQGASSIIAVFVISFLNKLCGCLRFVSSKVWRSCRGEVDVGDLCCN